ncbi:sepF Cell division protein SepF [Acidimicrobiia bacterium]
MSTMWHKAMVYLGLGPDDEYDETEGGYNARPSTPEMTAPVRQPAARQSTGTVRPRPQAPVFSTPPADSSEVSAVRPLLAAGADAAKPRVRAVPQRPNVRPHLVTPTSFNQAQEVADKFKNNQAVAFDLAEVDRDLARRLIDFASGLCYGLGGNLEKVAPNMYLLTPTGVEVPAAERSRLVDRTFADS